MPDVLLVTMPFGALLWPSIGLGLLKAGVTRRGITTDIRHFTFPFAERIGSSLYSTIANDERLSMCDQVGEWLFAPGLFDEPPGAVARFVQEILIERRGHLEAVRAPVPAGLRERIVRARSHVLPFLDHCAEVIVRARPRIVGFTSVFQQHVASLALARRIKQALPDTFIVFGGANCEGVMGAETVRQFTFVDAVVSGESDLIFPDLVNRLLSGQDASGLAGVRTPTTIKAEFALKQFSHAPMVHQLDELPHPDYADFFAEFGQTRLARRWIPAVLIETSRGCWWGERMHCTFCGLNGATMAFRSKSADRALAELEWLAARHPGSPIQAVDNILDLAYFRTLLPELAARRLTFGLFYETKSNLKKDQVRLLRDAGLRQIQPGIESFSDPILKLMRKGVSALQNIQLLKWCHEFGLPVHWNLIWGFPREPAEEYTRMAVLVPNLAHLPPPVCLAGLRLDRFSPYFFDADRLGIAGVAPLPAYRHVYRLPDEAVANLASHFEFGYREPQDPTTYVRPLLRAIRRWQRVHRESALFSVDIDNHLLIWDFRPTAAWPLVALGGLDRVLYLRCDAVCGLESLSAAATTAEGRPVAHDEIQRRLSPLVGAGLLLHDGLRYLSLAVPLGEYAPPADVVYRFEQWVRSAGRRDGRHVIVSLDDRPPPTRPARSNSARPRHETQHPPRPLTVGRFAVTADGDVIVRLVPAASTTSTAKTGRRSVGPAPGS